MDNITAQRQRIFTRWAIDVEFRHPMPYQQAREFLATHYSRIAKRLKPEWVDILRRIEAGECVHADACPLAIESFTYEDEEGRLSLGAAGAVLLFVIDLA